MPPHSATTGNAIVDGEVVSAVDDGLFLVADLTRDDAWLGMHCRDAPVLAEYR